MAGDGGGGRNRPRRTTTGTSASSAECYAPNGASRITNGKNEIVRIVNNYARMSYNFGPTLLKWMADNTPRTYRTILDADRSQRAALWRPRLGDCAGLQPIILPLANRRDAMTQIRWGIADFEHRSAACPKACGWRRLR